MNTVRPPSSLSRRPSRRQELRFAARFPVLLCSARTKDALSTWDVSFRGLYLETRRQLALRQLVRVAISLPTTGKDLIAHGMVASVAADAGADGRPPGMGIELYALDTAARTAWWEAVRFARDLGIRSAGAR